MGYSRMTPHLLPEGRSIMADIPQATALEARSAIFLPIQKITARTIAAFKRRHPDGYKVATGDKALTITIDSPLAQPHKDLLELLSSSLRPYYSTPGSRAPTYVYTRYWATDGLGIPDKYKQLDDMIAYLQKPLITIAIKLPSGEVQSHTEGLITRSGKISQPEVLAHELGIPVTGTRELRYVRISEYYMDAFAADDSLRYPSLVPRIVGLSHPVLKALVRHALSHRILNHALMDSKAADGQVEPGLLTKIGVYSETEKFEAQRLILDRNEELMCWGLDVKRDARKRLCVFLAGRIKDCYYYCKAALPAPPSADKPDEGGTDKTEADLMLDGQPIPSADKPGKLTAYASAAAQARMDEVLAAGGTEDEARRAASERHQAILAFALAKARAEAGSREATETEI